MPRPPDPRRSRFWELQDFSLGHGLEIGPLHRPILVPDEARVQYADVFDAGHLREFYESHQQVITEDIPEIDFVLLQDGAVRRLAEATAANAPYDWIIASHVIEHVPDLIDWLAQVAEITIDDGTLILAVPDRRFTFDLHRPFTSVGQILQAHELGDDRPSTRAVFDHFRSHVTVPAPHLWAGGTPPTYEARTYGLDHVLRQVERRRSGEYVDAHVWTFTPDTFLAQMSELRRLGHSSWFVESIAPTARNTLEFLVRMRRIPRSADASTDPDAEVASSPQGPDWVVDQHAANAQVRQLKRRVRKLEVREAQLKERERQLRDRDRQLRKEVHQLENRLRKVRRRIQAMQSSRRWRLAEAVVAPVRRVRHLMRRLPGTRRVR